MIATVSLALATIAFVGTHLAMSHPLRVRLVQTFGEQLFQLLYSLVAAVTLIWMILAWRSVNSGAPWWIAPLWFWPIASGVMLFALILLVGSFVRNPAFPHPGAKKQAARPATGVFAITRHPMNWSFILWALVHIALWGSARNLIVAAGILVLALAGSIGQDRKKAALLGESWREWQGRTSFVPFGALVTRRVPLKALAPAWVAVLIGTVLWLAITWYHAPLVSPLGGIPQGIG